ncbi:MAG: PD40 domain-containing protein [Armatimonadetes bacterium]|nr:PD40 domain-containing protein [Armatimonadota bacterium]
MTAPRRLAAGFAALTLVFFGLHGCNNLAANLAPEKSDQELKGTSTPAERDPAGEAQAQRIVFNRSAGSMAFICSVNSDGTGFSDLTDRTEVHKDLDPTRSPSGEHIAFTRRSRDRASHAGIYIMSPDGSNVRSLTSSEGFDGPPKWLPDSERIVFFRQGPGEWKHYVVDITNGSVSPVPDWMAGAWSPDGTRVAFVVPTTDHPDEHDMDLWVCDADGSNQQRLTRFETAILRPSWSPDGETVLFVAEIGSGSQVLTVHAATGKIETLLEESETYYESPAWSPTGKRIAVVRSPRGADYSTPDYFRQIWVMDVATGNFSRVTNARRSHYRPLWMADGKELVYQGNFGNNSSLYIANIEGSEEFRLTDAGGFDNNHDILPL